MTLTPLIEAIDAEDFYADGLLLVRTTRWMGGLY